MALERIKCESFCVHTVCAFYYPFVLYDHWKDHTCHSVELLFDISEPQILVSGRIPLTKFMGNTA